MAVERLDRTDGLAGGDCIRIVCVGGRRRGEKSLVRL